MRMIACCLCAGEEPFTCPFKFRRSYMMLHLEKAHGMPVRRLRFVRQNVATGVPQSVWMTGSGDELRPTLLEFKVAVPLPVQTGPAQKRSPEPRKVPDAEQWTAAGFQALYRERGGRQPA